MQTIILLPGNSISNKEWIEEIQKKLLLNIPTVKILYYQHWNSEQESIDLKEEIEHLKKLIKGEEPYSIFAKSVGTLLAMSAIYHQEINPEKCVFAGTAISWGKHYGFEVDKWLENYSVPSLFIQKSNDPAISFNELKELLVKHNVKNYQLKEIQGEDHHYENTEELKEFILKFID